MCRSVTLLLLLWTLPTASAVDLVKLIAHRGGVVSDTIIGNSRASIEAAIQRGYWMGEVDVRRTADGVPIAHHDMDFRRFCQDRRKVCDMTWEEISQLRSSPGGEHPLRLVDYLQACDGRLKIMLNIKAERSPLPAAFLDELERVMKEAGQLKSAYMIGTEEASQHFPAKLRISRKYEEIASAREAGNESHYFLFPRDNRVTEDEIRQGLALEAPVAPSINAFHSATKTRMQRARQDIEQLGAAGVTEFQIDSVFDEWLISTEATSP